MDPIIESPINAVDMDVEIGLSSNLKLMGEQTAVGVAGSVGAAGCLSGRSTGSFPAPSWYVLVTEGPPKRGAVASPY